MSEPISSETTSGERPATDVLLKATIVCADDDPTALERLRLLLTEEGFEVLTRESTSGTLECMWERLPDLVIIDPMMARMAGYELCKQLRTHPETERVPIVLHTTAPVPADKGWYDCVCSKPADRSVLLLAIRTLLMVRP
jgi:chemotaxis family two-component system response regulator PixH